MVNIEDLKEPVSQFNGHQVFSVIEKQLQVSSKFIQQMNPDVLLNTPVDDIVAQVVSQYGFDVPELHRDQAHLEEPREIRLTIQDYGRTIHPMGTILKLVVPFTGDVGLFSVTPSQFNYSPPSADIGNNILVLTVKGTNLDHAQVAKTFTATLDEFDMWLGWLRTNAQELEVNLKRNAKSSVEARRERLLADRHLIANLPFKIRARTDAPKTYVAPVTRKTVVQRPAPQTAAAFEPEPVLEEEVYGQILKIIDGMAHVMERSPTAFETMGEEDLRQHFLVQLNGQFEGAASGETFNFTGKTDILIRVQDRNIFIGECKFWGGEKAFLDTISQLLGYLSWRDTKAAVVIFNRNVDFSGMLKTMEAAIAKHPNLKRGPMKETETRYRCVFGNPSDANREVIVTVMAFNVPKP
jgi:hypothetical protein